MEPIDSSKQAWTFGQVVSVFTLVAPLISVLGALEESESWFIYFLRAISRTN